MLYVDLPTRSDIEYLAARRAAACISIYLPTTPLTQDAQADRIALGNLAREVRAQLEAASHDSRSRAAIAQHLEDLGDDDDFWAVQARSLAVFVTAEQILTFRLANRLSVLIEVADRFHLKPLLRAVTTGQDAFVLALAQGKCRLIEVSADMPAQTVNVPGLPQDMSDAVGRSGLDSRAPRGRIPGAEGKKVRMAQYARAVDGALRDLLAGRETPLILAATAPLDSLFRAACTYPHLTARTIEGNPETTSDHDLAIAARAGLDQIHADQVAEFAALFEARSKQGRTTTDLAHAAKAATFGAVAAIAFDMDVHVPGLIDDETGEVTLADKACAATYGVVDQIVVRSFLAGGRALALRRDQIPGGGDLAAVLRYPF